LLVCDAGTLIVATLPAFCQPSPETPYCPSTLSMTSRSYTALTLTGRSTGPPNRGDWMLSTPSQRLKTSRSRSGMISSSGAVSITRSWPSPTQSRLRVPAGLRDWVGDGQELLLVDGAQRVRGVDFDRGLRRARIGDQRRGKIGRLPTQELH